MKYPLLTSLLTIIASLFAGIIGAILTSQSLDNYAAWLLDDRRFAALAQTQSRTPNTFEESVTLLQKTTHNTLVFFAKDTESTVSGTGVIISADGWILTSRDALAQYQKNDGSFTDFIVKKGEEIFLVDAIIPDTQTSAITLHVQHAQGWTPLELAEMNSVLPGSMLFAAANSEEIYTSAVLGRISSNKSASAETYVPWNISESIPQGLPVFTAQNTLFGFTQVQGTILPAHSLRPLIKNALRATPVLHGALGVFLDNNARITAPLEKQSGILANGPADTGELLDGDILVALDNIQITKLTPCADILALYAPGQQVTLEVRREEETYKVQITLGAWEELVY